MKVWNRTRNRMFFCFLLLGFCSERHFLCFWGFCSVRVREAFVLLMNIYYDWAGHLWLCCTYRLILIKSCQWKEPGLSQFSWEAVPPLLPIPYSLLLQIPCLNSWKKRPSVVVCAEHTCLQWSGHHCHEGQGLRGHRGGPTLRRAGTDRQHGLRKDLWNGASPVYRSSWAGHWCTDYVSW